jgi:sulfur carrier protein
MNNTPNIQVLVNGESIGVARDSNLVQLLEQLKIHSRAIAVELNHEVQSSDRFSQCRLQEGDVLEIVTLVGGG